jgi:rhodanese-related sulfurtransferase
MCIVALVLAGANVTLNPKRPAWSQAEMAAGEIQLHDALSAGQVLWIDARTAKDYQMGRIKDALLLNEDDWDECFPEVLKRWQPGQWVVVYCSSRQCQASHEVAQRLRIQTGMENVFVLKGGWETWLARKP